MRGYFFRRFVKTSNRWCLEGRAERDVWATNKGTSEDDAMSKYVAVADRVCTRGRRQLRLTLVAPSTGVLARSARHRSARVATVAFCHSATPDSELRVGRKRDKTSHR